MRQFQYTVQIPHGIHGRPAMQLVHLVTSLDSQVTVERDGKSCNAAGLMGLMLLDVQQGQNVTIYIEGGQEAENQGKLETFFAENL